MTPEELRYWKKQLGLNGGSPAEQRKIAKARRPARWAPKRPAKRQTLGERARRWWKQNAPSWAGGKATPKRQRRKARKARKGNKFGPIVTAFLAGDSVRRAVYFHGNSDPAVMVVSAWPDQVTAGEAAIRASMILLLEEVEKLRAQLGAEE